MGPGTVKEYYNSYGRREWDRLTASAYNQVEYAITMHYLEKYLPKEGLVLDAGGGPGRYAIELARRGYDVVLFDLSPVQLAIAKAEVAKLPSDVAEHIIAFVEGDITDLGAFPTGDFDALVCLGGTLSHVVDPTARERATSEMARTLAPRTRACAPRGLAPYRTKRRVCSGARSHWGCVASTTSEARSRT